MSTGCKRIGLSAKHTVTVLSSDRLLLGSARVICSDCLQLQGSVLCGKQVAQLSQRDRAAGLVSYGQKWKTGTWETIFTDIISLYSTTVTYLANKAIEFGENAKKAIMPFKVIQGHRRRYQSKAVYDFLLVINTN